MCREIKRIIFARQTVCPHGLPREINRIIFAGQTVCREYKAYLFPEVDRVSPSDDGEVRKSFQNLSSPPNQKHGPALFRVFFFVCFR